MNASSITPDDEPDLDFIEYLGASASELIRAVYKTAELNTELKRDGTRVTDADRQVHEFVLRKMSKKYPHIPVYGEEGRRGMRTGKPDECWLLMDELDGTDAFSRGIPTGVTMIALMRGDLPMRSVIFEPFTERFYEAEKDVGAWLGRGTWSKNLFLHTAKPDGRPIVDIVVWPHNGINDMLVYRMVDGVAADLHHKGYQVQSIGSIGMAMARVASGEFHATVFPGSTLHDTAPGHLIVQEAGGVCTDLRGEALRYGGTSVYGHIAACDALLHAELVRIVGKYLPPKE